MANEAVCIEAPRIIKRYTVENAIAIAKGTILELAGDNKAAASSGAGLFAGIAVEEKTAGDGIVEIGAAIDGVWDLTATATPITLGGMVSLSGANLIKQAVEAETVTGAIIGKALEAASASEVIRVRLGAV